jgi:ABC-2 type transport system permease protein
LISSISNSQQVAMLLSVVVLFLPTAMLSGFMFPVENMPAVLRFISYAVPARWFYTTVINIMIKGLGFEYVWKETLILAVMTVFFLAVSIINFKTRLE